MLDERELLKEAHTQVEKNGNEQKELVKQVRIATEESSVVKFENRNLTKKVEVLQQQLKEVKT